MRVDPTDVLIQIGSVGRAAFMIHSGAAVKVRALPVGHGFLIRGHPDAIAAAEHAYDDNALVPSRAFAAVLKVLVDDARHASRQAADVAAGGGRRGGVS